MGITPRYPSTPEIGCLPSHLSSGYATHLSPTNVSVAYKIRSDLITQPTTPQPHRPVAFPFIYQAAMQRIKLQRSPKLHCNQIFCYRCNALYCGSYPGCFTFKFSPEDATHLAVAGEVVALFSYFWPAMQRIFTH